MRAASYTAEPEGRRFGLITVAVVGAAQVLSIALSLGAPFQPLLSILFVLTCPGFLLLDLVRPKDFSARLMIAIGGSLSINVAIATIVLVAEMRWVAPLVALSLVAIAALPQDRLRDAVSRLGSAVGVERRPIPALPAGAPLDDTASDADLDTSLVDAEPESGLPEAAPEVTQVGTTVGIGEIPEMATLEVPVLDEAAAAPALVDINTAGADELIALPGVGPKLAERIVEYRGTHGPLDTFDDLLQVPGIGPSKLRGLPDVAMVGSATAVATESDKAADATASESGASRDDPEPPGGAAELAADDEVAEGEAEPAADDEAEAEDAAPTAPVDKDDDEDEASAAGWGLATRLSRKGQKARPADTEEPTPASAVDDAGDAETAAEEPDAEPEPQPAAAAAQTPKPSPEAIDVNGASAGELTALPGIGPAMARRIVAHRSKQGSFEDAEGLTAVSGLGEAKVADLAGLVRFGPLRSDLNTADAEALAQVNGIGPQLAARIVAYRNANGPFAEVADLVAVNGVGAAKLERLRSDLTV